MYFRERSGQSMRRSARTPLWVVINTEGESTVILLPSGMGEVFYQCRERTKHVACLALTSEFPPGSGERGIGVGNCCSGANGRFVALWAPRLSTVGLKLLLPGRRLLSTGDVSAAIEIPYRCTVTDVF